METNPLTPEIQRQVDNALQTLYDQQGLIEKCHQCGLALGDIESQRQQLISQLSAIKQHFFTPGGSGIQDAHGRPQPFQGTPPTGLIKTIWGDLTWQELLAKMNSLLGA
jgi:hypothetical protein